MHLKFDLGQILATPGALSALEQYGIRPLQLLARHAMGDWGSVCSDDAKLNDEAVQSGGRVLSSYEISPQCIVWIITEAASETDDTSHDPQLPQRSCTTILLPSEY